MVARVRAIHEKPPRYGSASLWPYTELPEEFYIPARWRGQDAKNRQGSIEAELPHHGLSSDLLIHCRQSYNLYQCMLKDGVAREMARMVLPVNIYTEIYSCWDLKNLLHFVTLREDSHAQAEIQDYGRAIKAMLVELFPWTMAAYEKFKWQVVEAA